jgi:hypothetical protein
MEGGRMGFTTDKKLLQDNADWFIERYLANKKVRELKIIESFPEAHITPTLVLESGLVTKRVSTKDQVIYFKTKARRSIVRRVPVIGRSLSPTGAVMKKWSTGCSEGRTVWRGPSGSTLW